MTSTADPLFKVELQGAGDNPGAWHTPLNNALSQIVEGTSQLTTVSCAAGGAITLTDTQYVSNQARSGGFIFTGTLPSNTNVAAPNREKLYYLSDETTHGAFILQFSVTGGSSITLQAGYKYWVYCDGAGTVKVIASSDVVYGTTSGINSVVISTTPAKLSYYAGMEINVKFTSANTSAAYATVDGLGYKQIVKDVSSSLAASDITAGITTKLIYDGTNLVIFVPKIASVLGISDGGLKDASFNAAVNTRYVTDNDSGSFTVTFPASAALNDVIIIAKFGAGNLTYNWNGLKFNGSTSTRVTSAESSATYTYTGADRGWVEG